MYHDCGQFYLVRVDRFLSCQTLVMPSTLPLVMDEREVQDIDNESDWVLAELKYRLLHSNAEGEL